jgi:hypothetical protein
MYFYLAAVPSGFITAYQICKFISARNHNYSVTKNPIYTAGTLAQESFTKMSGKIFVALNDVVKSQEQVDGAITEARAMFSKDTFVPLFTKLDDHGQLSELLYHVDKSGASIARLTASNIIQNVPQKDQFFNLIAPIEALANLPEKIIEANPINAIGWAITTVGLCAKGIYDDYIATKDTAENNTD